MRLTDRAIHLAMAFLLPVVCLGSVLFFSIASIQLGETDRAIVWAEGGESQLDHLAKRIVDNGQFADGRAARSTANEAIPGTCGAQAREFSIGSLRVEEAQAARLLIETLATQSGARVCLTNIFIINELPKPGSASLRGLAVAAFLQSMLLPCGIGLLVYWMFSGQFALSLRNPASYSSPALVGIGLVAGLAAWLAAHAISLAGITLGLEASVSPKLSVPAIGLSLAFALALAGPFVEELAFRAWMIPFSERAIGTLPGSALSTIAYTAAQVPGSPWEALSHLAQGTIYAAVYLRTRSLFACALAHSACAIAGFSLATA